MLIILLQLTSYAVHATKIFLVDMQCDDTLVQIWVTIVHFFANS